MKKQILIFMLALLLIGNVFATNIFSEIINPKPLPPVQIKLCNFTVDQSEAIEQVSVTKQVPVMEDKIIIKTILDSNATEQLIKEYTSQFLDYRYRLINYQTNLKLKTKMQMQEPITPSAPVYVYTNVTSTIKVPKVDTITKYYLDWSSFPDIIKTKTISVPVYQNVTSTVNQIKSDYHFDEDSGTFYTTAPCNNNGGGGIRA